MHVTLNGQLREINEKPKLKDTIQQFCKDSRHVIAEVNGEIIKHNLWDEITLKDGDKIELVNFVGGG